MLIAAALLILSLVLRPQVPAPFFPNRLLSQTSATSALRPLSVPTKPPPSAPIIPAKGTAARGTPYAAGAPLKLRLCQPQIRFWPARSKAVRRLHARSLPHNQSNIAHLVKSRSKTRLARPLQLENPQSEACHSLTDAIASPTLARRCSVPSLSLCRSRIASHRIVIACFPASPRPLWCSSRQEPLDAIYTRRCFVSEVPP